MIAHPLRISLLGFVATVLPVTAAPDFHDWAPSPPMGWNSWDCFGTTVTEDQTKSQTDSLP